MAQVDRTMQILSGGDLDAVRSNKDKTGAVETAAIQTKSASAD